MSLSELLENKKEQKRAKTISRIHNLRHYRDAFGNELKSSKEQMEFLLRNFDLDLIQKMLKNKRAYILFDERYVEVFFAHSLTTEDMCIVLTVVDPEEGEDEQAAITLDNKAKLIDTYIGEIKYDYNQEDNRILI